MVFLRLFLEFFKIGICAFGGGLATIPFLEELSSTSGWFTLEELANMIAVSESTPGAIGVNMSTYVGYQAVMVTYDNVFLGFLGGMTATLAFVSPSIMIILIICQFLNKFRNSKYVNWAFNGLRAASFGLICSAAYSILKLSIITPDNSKQAFEGITSSNFITDIWGRIPYAVEGFFDYKCLALALVLGLFIFKGKKKLHPIVYIGISAVIGILFNF
jgi:chromate transporter